jgi:hypothetical protein
MGATRTCGLRASSVPARAGVDVDVVDGFFGFDVGDGDDDEDGINNSFFFSQVNSEVDDFEPGGIRFS